MFAQVPHGACRDVLFRTRLANGAKDYQVVGRRTNLRSYAVLNREKYSQFSMMK